jgi:hypothetical protein
MGDRASSWRSSRSATRNASYTPRSPDRAQQKSCLTLHLNEHLLYVDYPKLLLARTKMLAQQPRLARGDRVTFDAVFCRVVEAFTRFMIESYLGK